MKTLDPALRVCVRLCALFLILLLAACSNTTKPQQLPQFAIANVSVSVDATVRANLDVAADTRQSA